MDLFTYQAEQIPAAKLLADRMRPETLDEYIGQEQIVGQGKLLRRAIEADQVCFHPPVRPAGIRARRRWRISFPCGRKAISSS